MIHNPSAKAEILDLSPILASNPFKDFTFEMLAAFAHLEDMHVITLEQLLFLADKGRLKISFKFKEDPQGKVQEGPNISFTKQRFQNIL
ncbi:MAG: hypothetical protein L3J12_09715 [Spirochaetales bacterium]|nr:hypothetical protein [Spirochaetales bacterium]